MKVSLPANVTITFGLKELLLTAAMATGCFGTPVSETPLGGAPVETVDWSPHVGRDQVPYHLR
jgi:hypothetical protein